MQHGVWAFGGFYDASMTLTRLLGPLAVIVLVLAAPGAHAQGAAGARPVQAAKPAQGTATAPDAATAPKAPSAAETFPADSIRVTLPKESAKLLEGGPHGGRMIVFLAAEGAPDVDGQPIDAPFFDNPQPMFSVAVDDLQPGSTVTLDAGALSFPVPIAQLEGSFRAQALFDRDRTERGHLAPGNLVSDVVTIHLGRDQADAPELTLSSVLPPLARPEAPNLRWFELRSERLSKAAGRDVVMRAGIALPPGWDDPNFRRRLFPAVYVIPGFGGRFTDAQRYARLLSLPTGQTVVPQAVWIVLDPEAPLGHHGFVDSPANGPWGTALVEEFIPALERNFRLIPRTAARIVTGHSSGGWSSLWLQLEHPDTFGACFSSSPDPLDFSRFQASDLYADTSIFTDAEGKERPSYRVPIAGKFEKVRMTVREEASMERVLGPARDSGEQWDAWSAMWSAVDPATRLPRPMFDAVNGTIDHGTVRSAWSRFDVAARVRADPARYVPIFRERVRLLCGSKDSYYLDRGVEGLQAALAEAAEALARKGQMLPDGPGYVRIVPDETHETMGAAAALRWNREMRDYLTANKLD
jgi:hypothetical protein